MVDNVDLEGIGLDCVLSRSDPLGHNSVVDSQIVQRTQECSVEEDFTSAMAQQCVNKD